MTRVTLTAAEHQAATTIITNYCQYSETTAAALLNAVIAEINTTRAWTAHEKGNGPNVQQP